MIRKGNIFMIAYVLFLIVSVYIANQSNLNKIAFGATYAGLFFAFADALGSGKTYFTKSLENILSDNDVIQKRLEEISNNIKLHKTSDEKLNSLLKNCCQVKQSALKLKKRIQQMSKIGNILFCGGIVIFLLVLAFYNEQSSIFNYWLFKENEITILAFAIVVLNYYLSDIFTEMAEKQICELKKLQAKNENGQN